MAKRVIIKECPVEGRNAECHCAQVDARDIPVREFNVSAPVYDPSGNARPHDEVRDELVNKIKDMFTEKKGLDYNKISMPSQVDIE